jgi:uncharacterized damage-inducible protein DinB
MGMSESLLFEFNQEMATTRKTLERVPLEKADWKPHAKSMTLGGLASHVANIPGWVVPTLRQDSLDLAPPGGKPFVTPLAKTRDELLDFFDQGVEAARQAMGEVTDDRLLETWSLLMGGKVAFSAPRIGVLRGMVLNHNVHHRAQLGVYLRMNDVALPSTYGPSADEGAM